MRIIAATYLTTNTIKLLLLLAVVVIIPPLAVIHTTSSSSNISSTITISHLVNTMTVLNNVLLREKFFFVCFVFNYY